MEPRPPTSPSPSPLATGRDVLVVEDEARVRDMLSRALKEMGFQAALAASAEAGGRALAGRAFDILILDLNLPGIGGIEFLESVRRKNPDIQAIILTGVGDLAAARKAIHLDVVEFLTKPCALGDLEKALDRARKRRREKIVGGMTAPTADPALQFETAPRKPPPPAAAPPPATGGDPGLTGSLEELEQKQILSVLQKHNGNRAATAAELGISLRKLYYRLGEYQKKGLVP